MWSGPLQYNIYIILMCNTKREKKYNSLVYYITIYILEDIHNTHIHVKYWPASWDYSYSWEYLLLLLYKLYNIYLLFIYYITKIIFLMNLQFIIIISDVYFIVCLLIM